MPQIGTPMVNVMMCTDQIVIPTQAELLSAQGLKELVKHYKAIQKNSNHELQIAGVLVTMDSAHTLVSAHVNSMLQDTFEAGEIRVFKTRIPRSIKVAEACLYQKTICEYMPTNAATIAYEEFVKELMNHAIKRET